MLARLAALGRLMAALVLAGLCTPVLGCTLEGNDERTVDAVESCSQPKRKFVRQAWAMSGGIEDIDVHCNTIYVAGGGTIGRRTGPLAAVSAGTGRRVGSLPELSGEIGDVSGAEPLIQAVVDDGSGGWFVAGAFAFADQRRCPGVVHVLRTGRLDADFCPRTNGPVSKLALNSETLYLAGSFSNVGGRPREKLAAVTITTGRLLPWAPRVDPKLTCPDRDEPGEPVASIAALAASSSAVYVGGFFTGIDGLEHPGLVAVDAVTGAALAFDAGFRSSPQDCNGPIVGALLIHADGLVVAGNDFQGDLGPTFLRVLDPQTGRETAARLPGVGVNTLAALGSTLYVGGFFGAAAFDLETGNRLPWRPRIRGDVCCYVPDRGVETIFATEGKVYIGGNFARVGDQKRNFAAAVDDKSGAVLPWDPRPNGPVLGIGLFGRRVLLAGTLTSINVERRFGLVAIDGPTGRLLDWTPRAGGTNAITVSRGRLFVGGNFNRIEGRPRQSLAAFDLETRELVDWSPAIGAISAYGVTVLSTGDGRVYAGGDYRGAAPRIDAPSEPRVGVAAFDAESGDVLDWNPELSADNGSVHVHAIAPADGIVYLGGEFDMAGGVAHRGAVAVDLDGDVTSEWNPAPDNLGFVYAMAVGASGVYLGGWFSEAGGAMRSALGLVAATTGKATEFEAKFSSFAQVHSVAQSGGQLFVAGDFSHVQDRRRAGFASLDAATGRLLRLSQAPQDRARFSPDTVTAGGGAILVDGYIQGNGEQLVVHPLKG